MSSDPDEREAFEKWAEANQFCIHRDDTPKYVEYHRATTRFAWQAWQARADSAVPSSHVSETDEPEPLKFEEAYERLIDGGKVYGEEQMRDATARESILREALARLVASVETLDSANTACIEFNSAEFSLSLEAARSALAGIP